MAALEKLEPERDVIQIRPKLTPADMLHLALSQGSSIDILEKLMALQERSEKSQARKEFDAAVASAKSEIRPVVKNREGHNGRYADFAAIARAVDPIISKHGLSYRFRTQQSERITVTCILTHRDGHSEENSLSSPVDTSGSKNAIQAIGSALTYLQRYSLCQALGIAVTNDDDGNGAGTATGEVISEAQVDELQRLIAESRSDIAKFLRWARAESLSDIPAGNFETCKQTLERALRARTKAEEQKS